MSSSTDHSPLTCRRRRTRRGLANHHHEGIAIPVGTDNSRWRLRRRVRHSQKPANAMSSTRPMMTGTKICTADQPSPASSTARTSKRPSLVMLLYAHSGTSESAPELVVVYVVYSRDLQPVVQFGKDGSRVSATVSLLLLSQYAHALARLYTTVLLRKHVSVHVRMDIGISSA